MLIPLSLLVKKYNLKEKVNGVVHVGGHIGEEVPEYLSNEWNVIIFEPQKSCFDKIINDNRVEKYNVALGPEKKLVELHIASNNESSSILAPKTHLIEHPHISFNSKIIVEQDLLDNYDTKNFNFLNLDVQGYELEVLKGAEKTLSHIDYIYTEVNTNHLYENCVLLDELDGWLNTRGFERVAVSMTKFNWGDALYVKY